MYFAKIIGIKVTLYNDSCEENTTKIFTLADASHAEMIRQLINDMHIWINSEVPFALSDKYPSALKKILRHYLDNKDNISDEIYIHDVRTKTVYIHILPVLEDKLAKVIYL